MEQSRTKPHNGEQNLKTTSRHPRSVETWCQHPPLLPQVRPQSVLLRILSKGLEVVGYVLLNNCYEPRLVQNLLRNIPDRVV